MAYKHNCGCGGGGCNCVPNIVDINCVKEVPWESVDTLLGIDSCQRTVGVEKPLYELSALDRDKLDALKLDGDGTYFLADDGTYKPISFETDTIVLDYYESAANFVINNQEKLSLIWDKVQDDKEAFIHLFVDPYTLPINYAYGTRTLILEYDRPIITVTGDDIELTRLKISIAMFTDVYPFNVVYYEVRTYVDADGIVVTNGDGNSALFNDGQYKPVYTKAQVDALVAALNERIDNADGDISSLEGRVTVVENGLISANERIDQNAQSITDLANSTTEAFNTVNSQLDALDERVTVNEGNIEINRIEIENLRDDFTNLDHFRGYFETTDQITAISNPTNGDYAWNAETGTVWTYNGTTWANSGVPIPDQTVLASESIPQVPEGNGDVGVSLRYMRADAVIPSDPTKVNIEDLDAYLPLAGNTQATRMTGDIWMSNGNQLILTNSGNSYLRQNSTDNVTELNGNGVGGINLIAGNGTVKANGEEIVTYDTAGDINAKRNIILKNDCKLLGTDATSATHNLIEYSRFGIIDAGSSTTPFNITSSARPTVQLSGETGAQAHAVAFLSDVTALETDLTDQLNDLETQVVQNTADIEVNTTDIENLREDLAARELFRGYYATTNQITSLPNPVQGNYAWNAQTGTVWVYNGTTWADSGDPIPDQTVTASDQTPAVPQGTGYVGLSEQYMRADAVIPQDPTKASVASLNDVANDLSELSDELDNYKESNDSAVSNLNGLVASNTSAISGLGNRVTNAEGNIVTLQNRASGIEGNINTINETLSNTNTTLNSYITSNNTRVTNLETAAFDTQGRVSALENQGQSLTSRVAVSEQNILAHNTRIATNEANIANLLSGQGTIQTGLTELQGRVSTAESNISTNTSDIESILQQLSDTEHFRGYYQTTDEVTAIANPEAGDYAWNGETNTVWLYNGTTWTNSGQALPDVIVTASDALPLIDGAADAGTSLEYSRGDHRHPTDTTRASQSDFSDLSDFVDVISSTLTDVSGQVDGIYTRSVNNEVNISSLQNSITGLQSDVTGLQSDVSVNTSAIDAVNNRVELVDGDIITLENRVSNHDTQIAGLSGRVTALESEINDINTNVVTITGQQNITGQKTFNGSTFLNALPVNASSYIGSSVQRYNSGYFRNLDAVSFAANVISPSGNNTTIGSNNSSFDSGYIITLNSYEVRSTELITNNLNTENLFVNGHPIVTDGTGDMFLSDDGTYKVISGGGSDYVDLTSNQTITGVKTFSDNIISTGVVPVEFGAPSIGLATNRFNRGYFNIMNATSYEGLSIAITGAATAQHFNNVPLTALGDGSRFLANDGNYRIFSSQSDTYDVNGITVGTGITILDVFYNGIKLRDSQYSIISDTLTILDTNITSVADNTDFITYNYF